MQVQASGAQSPSGLRIFPAADRLGVLNSGIWKAKLRGMLLVQLARWYDAFYWDAIQSGSNANPVVNMLMRDDAASEMMLHDAQEMGS